MRYAQNVISSLEYQLKRRLQNPISSAISILIMLSFVWVYRSLAVWYWPSIRTTVSKYPKTFYVLVLYFCSLTTHALNFGVYYVVDKYGLFQDRKISKTGLLWETDPEAWRKLRNRSIKINILNICVIGLVSGIVDSFYLKPNILSPTIPAYSTIMYQLFIFFMMDGFFFYLFHKLGHTVLYSIHKVHHEFKVPTLLATNHFHPIQYFFGVVLPLASGPKLFLSQTHLITMTLWVIFKIGEGHDAHSNYELPWSPFRAFPQSTTSEYHSFHHTHNEGNFCGTELVGDTAFLDNAPFFKYKKQLENAKSTETPKTK